MRPVSYYQELEDQASNEQPRQERDIRRFFERQAHPIRWFFKSWFSDEPIGLWELIEPVVPWIVAGWILLALGVFIWNVPRG